MASGHTRTALIVVLLACATLLFAFPVQPEMTTDVIFDDEASIRIDEESPDGSSKTQLILRIRHDDRGEIASDFDRVQELLQLEKEAMDGSNPATSWDDDEISLKTIESPFKRWSDAFDSRNLSLENATRWGELIEFKIWDGWCGENATEEEYIAFQASLLLFPENATLNLACPATPGSDSRIAPASSELLWLVRLETDAEVQDWNSLYNWAEKISENTDYEVEAVGVNMLFTKAKKIAEDDLKMILIPCVIILAIAISLGLRDPITAAATLGGASLVVCAELGLLSALGFQFSILDGIAIPIIMGVAVDGAFWYCKSSRTREEVRSMLFLAMVTTIAAVSLAVISPIRAQKSLGLVMAIGIFLDWVVTRFVLEEFYLKRRSLQNDNSESKLLPSHPSMAWSWPIVLILLASVAFAAPPGVEPLDVYQFLPEDDPSIAEMEELQSQYMLASSTVAWVIVDADGNSPEDYQRVLDLQQQLGQHPSVISLDNGMLRTPMVIGISEEPGSSHTIDSVSISSGDNLLFDNARLVRNDVTTGVAIAVMLDAQDSDGALLFSKDARDLLDVNGFEGEIGGDLPVGAEVAQSFEEERMTQILAAGVAIFLVSFIVLRSPKRAARIAIGTIAIGAAVDGLATIIGGRGVNTAPSVLLGMGFTADYLSHATADHVATRKDTLARWWAAMSSGCVFLLVGFSVFPPARNAGRLLSVSILLSVILATCLSLMYQESGHTDDEE